MAHYDLYQELNLNREDTSDAHSNELQRRISLLSPQDTVELDKLSTAQKVLGTPERREQYDRELANPRAEEIGIRRLREFANAPIVNKTTAPSTSGAHVTPVQQTQQQPQNQWQPQQLSAPAPAPQNSGWNQPAAPAPAATSIPRGNSAQNQIDFTVFGVGPSRSRSSSLMWTIGLGIIFLGWLVFLCMLIFDDSGTTQNASELGKSIEAIDKLGAIMFFSYFAILHTIAMTVFLQLMWNIRKIVGKRFGYRSILGDN